MKDDFLSTMSHELRSPLTSIKMVIELLDATAEQLLSAPEAEDESTPQRIQRYLNILNEQCDQELELVNTLLDLQRLEAQRLPVELVSIDVNEWATHVISAFVRMTSRAKPPSKS
jgi:signal transduction histidine kinase